MSGNTNPISGFADTFLSKLKEQKEILLQRITYLQDQRDKYVEDAINELKDK
jgi:hypothetical protein